MREFFISMRGKQMPAVIHEPSGFDQDKTLIISHGFRGSKDGGGRAVCFAEKVAQLGIAVIRFDFTPLECLSRQVWELGEVARFCRNYISKNIILMGRSMGGSAALAYAGADKDIMGLCLWATPWDLNETFRLALGSGYNDLKNGKNVFIKDGYGEITLDAKFIEDFNNFDLLSCVDAVRKIPLLILHGSNDEIVPVSQARMLWKRAGAPKHLAIIDGADHHFSNHSHIIADIVQAWLRLVSI